MVPPSQGEELCRLGEGGGSGTLGGHGALWSQPAGSLLPHSVEDFGTEVSRKRRGNKTEGRMGQGMGRGEGERQ